MGQERECLGYGDKRRVYRVGTEEKGCLQRSHASVTESNRRRVAGMWTC